MKGADTNKLPTFQPPHPHPQQKKIFFTDLDE